MKFWHAKLQIKELKVGDTFRLDKTIYMKTDKGGTENCTVCVDLATGHCGLLNKELCVELTPTQLLC